MSEHAEANFSVTGKAGGTLVTLRADSYQEFVANAQAALGAAEGQTYASSVFRDALLKDVPSGAATANLNKTVGPVTVVPEQPVPSVPNNVVPMPNAQPQAVPNPPTVPYPGDCQHGPRKYKSSQTKRGTWSRWECALDWQSGNDAYNAQRCQAVNA